MRITDYLTAERIVLDLEPRSKAEVLGRLVEVLAASIGAPDRDGLLREVMRREEVMSTGVGEGIAQIDDLFTIDLGEVGMQPRRRPRAPSSSFW